MQFSVIVIKCYGWIRYWSTAEIFLIGKFNWMKKRMRYALLFTMGMILEILIGMFVHDRLIRPYVGDILVVMVIYSFVRIFFPEKPRNLSLYVFLFAVFVEILQGTGMSEIPWIAEHRVLKIALGSTFDWADILCYAVGCAAACGAERWRQKASKQ